MTAKPAFRSDALAAIHETVSDMYRVGTVDIETMRTFDVSCLSEPEGFSGAEIKALREGLLVSQPVFARYLNISLSTIQKWESGAKSPSGPALKLLDIVRKHGLQMLI